MLRLPKIAGVIAHIAGPSGSGKTTLLQKIETKFPQILTKDLDEFDDQAEEILGYTEFKKKNYTDEMLKTLVDKRQELMDSFLEKNIGTPIVLGGHHVEDERHVLDVKTNTKLLLNTSPLTSAWRGYLRSQKEEPEHKRKLTELPFDYGEAKDDVQRYTTLGYKKMSPVDIMNTIADKLEKTASRFRLPTPSFKQIKTQAYSLAPTLAPHINEVARTATHLGAPGMIGETVFQSGLLLKDLLAKHVDTQKVLSVGKEYLGYLLPKVKLGGVVPTAVIVKGNPKYIRGNPDADRFYSDLKQHVEGLG